MIGALYLRSLDRAERVHAAMLIRGYQRQFAHRVKINTKRATLAHSRNFNRSRINNSFLWELGIGHGGIGHWGIGAWGYGILA